MVECALATSLQFPQGSPNCTSMKNHHDTGSRYRVGSAASLSRDSKSVGSLHSLCSVRGWAADFESLLYDPAGLHTFAEFLKKEFSHENIFFWCTCERFRLTPESRQSERRRLAEQIVERHLAPGAWEPVNVDSAARSSAQETLCHIEKQRLPNDIFAASQKQIYNLMKFDSYGRFLKSDLYTECLSAELKGKKLPYTGEDNMDPELHFQPEEKVRPKTATTRVHKKSFLPWSHLRPKPSSGQCLDLASSSSPCLELATSSHSLDLATLLCPPGTCRLWLPEGGPIVVQTDSGRSVSSLVGGVLQRTGHKHQHFTVLDLQSGLELDITRQSCRLDNREVRVVVKDQQDTDTGD